MNWSSIGEFIAMGGYGWYVWGAYDVTFILLALELVLVFRRHRSAKRQLLTSIDTKTRRHEGN